MEVGPSCSGGWSSLINHDGIGSNTGTFRQMFLYTHGCSNDENIFTVATSRNYGIEWEADFVIRQDGRVGIGTLSPGGYLEVKTNTVCFLPTLVLGRANYNCPSIKSSTPLPSARK